MIARHNAELGIKHISRVIVVTNDAPGRPKFGERPKNDLNIFFQIEDVPADDVTDDKPKDAESRRTRGVRSRRVRLRTACESKNSVLECVHPTSSVSIY